MNQSLAVSILALLTLMSAFAEEMRTQIAIHRAIELDTGFASSGDGSAANLIQLSTNLTDWKSYLSVFSKVPAFSVFDFDSTNKSSLQRFYRVRQGSGLSIVEQKARWASLGFTSYQFRLMRVCFCHPIFLTALVRVSNGKVVAVEYARDLFGPPIPNPELSTFKSIEEFFDLAQNQRSISDVFIIAFDDEEYFPKLIHIDPSAQGADDESTYQISSVQSLPPPPSKETR